MKPLTILFSFMIICLGHGQMDKNVFQDSISDLGLKELDRLAVQFENKDTLRLRIVANQLKNLARDIENDRYAARAYEFLTLIEKQEKKQKIFADSMVWYATRTDFDFLKSDAYYRLANAHYANLNYGETIKNLGISYKLAYEGLYFSRTRKIETRMASIKNVLGRHSDAKSLYLTAYKEFPDEPSRIKDKNRYLAILYNLAQTYGYLHMPDSCLYYTIKGKYAAKSFDSAEYLNLFRRLDGIAKYHLGAYKESIVLLKGTLPPLDRVDAVENLYFIGQGYKALKAPDSALVYYLKTDSVLSIDNKYILFQDKDLYKELYRVHLESGDELSEYFLERYFLKDSISKAIEQSVGEQIHTAYDLPQIKAREKELVTKKIAYRILALVLAISLLASLFLLLRKNRRLKRQKKLIGEYLENSRSISIGNKRNGYGTQQQIPNNKEKVWKRIADGLEQFELDKKYLDSKMDQSTLSKLLGTNTTDLSMFFNQVLGVSFPTYLKRKRIENAVKTLRENRNLYKYSISGLAEEFGFSNPDTFSRAFKQVAKVKPSLFITELQKMKFHSDDL